MFNFSRSHIVQTVLLVIGLVLPVFAGSYWTHVGALAWYYALLAASWALLAGYAGQFSFAHVAFATFGGYASALLVSKLGLSLPVAIVVALILAMVIGALVAGLVLRLSGPYLALFTLALSEIFRLILIAEDEVTRGMLGLEVPSFFQGSSSLPYYYLGLVLVIASVIGMNVLLSTRVGLFLRAIREDEGAAKTSGVNTVRYKVLVFVITSGIAAIAGIYYAHFVGILTPNMTILPEMGLVIAMTVIGGVESLPGAVLGGVVIYLLSELLRSYGEWRFVLLGLALILVQRFAQNGLYPFILNVRARRGRTQPENTAMATDSGEKNHVN